MHTIDQFGTRVIHEIDDVMNVVDGALGITSAFSGSLVDAEKKLALAASRDHVKAIIETLVRSTQ